MEIPDQIEEDKVQDYPEHHKTQIDHGCIIEMDHRVLEKDSKLEINIDDNNWRRIVVDILESLDQQRDIFII